MGLSDCRVVFNVDPCNCQIPLIVVDFDGICHRQHVTYVCSNPLQTWVIEQVKNFRVLKIFIHTRHVDLKK